MYLFFIFDSRNAKNHDDIEVIIFEMVDSEFFVIILYYQRILLHAIKIV